MLAPDQQRSSQGSRGPLPFGIPIFPSTSTDLDSSDGWQTHTITPSVSASSVINMRKPGKRCKERDACYCWNHSDVQDRYFFKVMMGDFTERLGIPEKFVQHFRGREAKSVKLESRTGCTFDVEVTKSLGKLVLQTGWKAFVRAHDLKMGDFLVFRYNGTSRLKVLTFDLSCFEKVLPCLATRCPIRGRGKGGKQIEISRSCDDLAMKSPERKRQAWKQRDGSMNVNTNSTSPSDSSGDSVSPEDQKSHDVSNYILPLRTHLTYVQKKKLKEKIRAICSKTPIYGCVMKKSNIDGKTQTMDISREYAGVYLPFEDQTLLLKHHGKSWEVRCHVKKSSRGTKRLLKGWKQFARDNNLKLGDLCLFELLENRKYMMNVHIIRAK